MRLWSLDFSYLDQKGLVALWREALLAKKVLEGKTKGYKNHSQLIRFRRFEDPLAAINTYLRWIYEEAVSRGYNFDGSKVDGKKVRVCLEMSVTKEQLDYEFEHLQSKLKERDFSRFTANDIRFQRCGEVKPCQLFSVIDGDVEPWEKVK